MRALPIMLKSPQEVKSFVNTMNRYSFDMDVRSGRNVVNAKSILGIFSLDLSKPVTLVVYHDSCDTLIDEIQSLVI